MPGQIFVITGPSGVGKGTLCKLLLQDDGLGLSLSVSATSRPRRAHEQDGVDYLFKTPEAFRDMIEQDARQPDPRRHHLLEWAEYNGNYYGTPRQAVEAALEAGRHVLLEIETQGALMIKQKFPAACLIFIAPPDEETLRQRLQGRGTDSQEIIRQRLQIATRELTLQECFDYVVVNGQLEVAFAEIKEIMRRRVGALPGCLD